MAEMERVHPVKMGRKPVYDRQAAVAHICERLAEGVPLSEICQDPRLPAHPVIADWQKTDREIDSQIRLARSIGYDKIASRVRKTARGFGPELGGDSTGDVRRDRLIVDTDLKLLAKWDPKRYGESFQLRHADADGGPLDASPRFLEALAMLKLAGAPVPVQITEVPIPAEPAADISDLL